MQFSKYRRSKVRFIIRTLAAGAISMAARIIIKKIQEKDEPTASAQPAE